MSKFMMRVLSIGLLTTLVATAAMAQPSVRINEVFYRGSAAEDWIELKNVGDQALDVSQYWFYSEGTSVRIDSLPLLFGADLTLDPDEIIVLQSWRDFDNQVADVSIFVDTLFNSPNSIVDFVCWGGRVGRYDIAVTAGVWGDLQQLPVAFDDQSSQWKGRDSGPGEATQAIDWVRDLPTPGEENAGRVPTEDWTFGRVKSRY